MQRRNLVTGMLAGVALAGFVAAVWGVLRSRREPALPARLDPVSPRRYSAMHPPLPPPQGPLATYHLGHSLVGRDMPAMLAALAGHQHALQLGWGASLRQHWEPALDIPGFETENATPAHLPARAAIESGGFEAIVLTEMVDLGDAIRWQATPAYLARWAQLAHAGRSDVRVYLYETWHNRDDPVRWAARIETELERDWIGVLLHEAAAHGTGGPVYLIPGGQALLAAVRSADAGRLDGIASGDALFAHGADGARDAIHLSDLGAYVIALVHYAVLYHRSPEGLPHALARADGSAAEAFTPEAAAYLQALVWQVVRTQPLTGVAA